jgi:phosphate transport system protein
LNTPSHFEETLQRDRDLLRGKVAEMARLSERALEGSLRALEERSRQLAYYVILRDQYIDELETELNRLCLEFVVRHQPVAGQLRFVFTTIQVNKELERIGDYAESIARQVLAVSALEPQPAMAKFVELGKLAIAMLRQAVKSFLEEDPELAARTMVTEEQGNTLRSIINAELLDLSRSGRLPTSALNPLMTISRRFERVTDQAKNLCEEVLYMCTGEVSKHKGGDAFRILFFDADNACLSQMAEGIGNALGLARAVFSSAGIAPQPLDARAVTFMAAKGIDISRQSSKTLEQVPHWEQYQVVVALSTQAREALSLKAKKTICFTWSVPEVPPAAASPQATTAAFESAFDSLQAHIQELVAAIVQQPQPETKV